jgi:cytochrome c553
LAKAARFDDSSTFGRLLSAGSFVGDGARNGKLTEVATHGETPMRMAARFTRFAGMLGACTLLGWPPVGAAVDASTLAARGNGRGVAPCASCHGADGAGQAAAGFPRLAGLNGGYLRKQLDDFASGTRENGVMQPIATALGADERQAISDYYARLPIPPAPARPTADNPKADSLGRLLATRGRWSQQVPGCEQCHGPGGVGVGEYFPPLAGQSDVYIQNQLKAWKQGTRHNDPLELMKHLSAALDDDDVKAVSAWFAALPLHATEATP